MLLGVLLISDPTSGCESEGPLNCLVSTFGVALGAAGAVVLLFVGAGVNSQIDRRSLTTVYYVGPVARYLPDSAPSVQSDL